MNSTYKRATALPFISKLLDGRPVRWARIIGQEQQRMLEVFNTDAKDQRELLGRMHKNRELIEEACGGPFIVIFHSVKQTAERYKEFAKDEE
jgi:hypothetical protein